jgi:hypothetical protein
MQQERRFVSLLIALENIREARDALVQAKGQGSPAVVQRREDELRQAREAYLRLVRVRPGAGVVRRVPGRFRRDET